MERELMSREVEELLGVPWWILWNLIKAKRIPAPTKNVSGFYMWRAADVARAREAVKNYRPRAASRGRVTPQPTAG
jgi:hypothetical protein